MLEIGTRRPWASVSSVSSVNSPLERVEASGRIDGLLMEMRFTQHYRNTGERPIEIAYTFPLSRAAVPLEIACRIGDREMTGRVNTKSEAVNEYEDAVGEGNSAVLVSRAADGMLSASLGNLLPGETAQITLRYGQLLDVVNGSVRVAFPTAIAPRYGNPADAGLDETTAPETDLRAEYPFSLALEIHGALARADVSCPSHAAQIARVGEALRVTVPRAALDRDLVLLAEHLPTEAEGYAAVGRDGAQTVTLASVVVPPVRHAALPLAVKVLVDCSGSMQGDSITQAREALGDLVRRMEDTDRMSLTRFGSTVRHEGDDMFPVSGASRRRLRQVIGALEADLGGTEMERALDAVYRLPAPDKDAVVLLITDGEIYATERLIAAASASGHRLFIVAVGSSPAESWLAKLAEQTGGAIEFVTPGEDVAGAIGRICAKLRAPRQKLRAVKWPGKIDLVGAAHAVAYEAETLHLFARLLDAPQGELDVEFANGRITRVLPADVQPGDTLARLFAAQRLRYETDTANRQRIALAYQLLTEDTSWVLTLARAEEEKGSAVPQLRKVKQMMAAGWGGTGQLHNKPLCYSEAPPEAHFAPAFFRSPARYSRQVDAYIPPEWKQRMMDAVVNVWGVAEFDALPVTFEALAAAGVPDFTIDGLRELLPKATERVIVLKFIAALLEELVSEARCSEALTRTLLQEAPADQELDEKAYDLAVGLI